MQRKILIVDDTAINRRILRRILSDEYDLLEAGNGRQALDVLDAEHEHVSAVILDLVMPEMDGYEFLTRMRAAPLINQIPVIVMTGASDEGAEVKALSLGANDFILKPYIPAVIKHRLWNVINLRETAAFANAASRDRLTGLYSREAFIAKAETMIAAHEPGYYTMTCFDIDGFKVINDIYGIAKGDSVLKEVADIFQEGFAPIGGICCRVMADSFAVLYPSSFMETDEVAEIRERAAKLDGSIPPIVFSIGRYIINDLTVPVNSMFDRAALAEASIKGRFDVRIAVFDESMRDNVLTEQRIVGEMSTALKGGQFEVWFQPQFNHASGALIGAEALVRWNDPQRGLVSPGEFIPVFERNGFIYELDKFVWEQTCSLLRRWIDAGRSPLPVSVNVSRVDALREDFFEVITSLVEKYALPVRLLCLEITESAFSNSGDKIILMVKRLRTYGFTVEIDDFGSGYSSLNTLKDVPADILKLDMRFLENTDVAPRGGNILESIVRMAKWLGMAVIAEGVETAAQADYLRSIGCFYIQGFLYAKPMTAADYEKFVFGLNKEHELITLETVNSLDNNAFWSPTSLETLIFNSYVGGACIIEYKDGRSELIRINEKYAQVLGREPMSMQDALSISWPSHMDEDGICALNACIDSAIATGDEAGFEAKLTGIPGGDSYLSVTLRVIASTGDNYLLYATISNITSKREADALIVETTEQLEFLNEISRGLLADGNTDRAINEVLRKTCAFFDGKRAYVFELGDNRATMSNSYEVCASGVEPMIDKLQNIPVELASFWFDAFKTNGHISISSIDDIGESRKEEQRILAEQGITALVAVPLLRDKSILGFIGVDDPGIRRSHVEHLEALGDFITVLLTRRDLSAEIISDRRSLTAAEINYKQLLPAVLSTVMKSTTDLSFVKDLNFTYICCSRAFAAMVGLEDENDIVGKTDYDLFDKTLADNYRADDKRLVEQGQPLIDFVETIPGDNGEIRVSSTSKYLLHDKDNNVIGIYGCGRDISEVRAIHDRLALITNNIPGGILSGELCGKRLQMLYMSNGIYTLTGYSPTEFDRITGGDLLILLYEADAKQLLADVKGLFRDETSFDLTVRLKDKSGSVHWLAVTGAHDKTVGERQVFNAFVTDVTSRKAAEQISSIHEQELRLAMEQMGKLIITYDVAAKTVTMPKKYAELYGSATVLDKMPDRVIKAGVLDEESIENYRGFFAAIERGERRGSTEIRIRRGDGTWGWEHVEFVTIFDHEDKPVNAVCAIEDTTDRHSEDVQNRAIRDNNRILQLVAAHSNRSVYRYNIAADEFIAGNIGDGVVFDPATVTAESTDEFAQLKNDIKSGKQSGEAKLCVNGADGHNRWIDMQYSLVNNPNEPVYAVVSFGDITENHEKELAYDRYLQSIAQSEGSQDTVLFFESNVTDNITEKYGGNIPDDYPPMGCKRDELIEHISRRYLHNADVAGFTQFFAGENLLAEFAAGKRTLYTDFRMARTDGFGYFRAELQMIQDPYSGDIKVYTTLRDITAIRLAEIDVKKRAETDGMTGLYNKTTAEALIRARLSRADGAPCALLIADLDNLKRINDTLGHAQGDAAIKVIAQTLRSQFRLSDIVGRTGGDEFIVFIDGVGSEAMIKSQMMTFMRRLTPVRLGDNRELSLHSSVGVALGTVGESDYDELFKKADRALYHVKRNGKGDYAIYSPEMENDNYELSPSVDDLRPRLFDTVELTHLLRAVSTIYPLVISANLTQNSYYMLEYDNYMTTSCLNSGSFDELIRDGSQTFHPDDRASFIETFSRQNMLAAHACGKRICSHIGRQLGDDGVYRRIRTDAVFISDKDREDVMEISLAREIDTPENNQPKERE